ncbi:MAG: hypothetical protein H6738_17145 [Alphaproteobacteria bacterium]|nr:hypothetical protein [Alphaproteobacteria bacterium]MCB9698511.1 hypothetical protein [Alphaproteobacteria bacterium]
MQSFSEVTRRADAFFMKASRVHDAARRVARALDELGIPYAIAGALAANAHGHVRTTGDVDLLLTPEGLAAFKARWSGRGWVDKFPGSKGMRDVVDDVPIDVLLTGDFPGDGLSKPVAFPSPSVAERSEDGYAVLPLRTLMELKIASGMTAPHRPRDLDDAIQLIRANDLPRDWPIDPYVGDRYRELWALAQIHDDE